MAGIRSVTCLYAVKTSAAPLILAAVEPAVGPLKQAAVAAQLALHRLKSRQASESNATFNSLAVPGPAPPGQAGTGAPNHDRRRSYRTGQSASAGPEDADAQTRSTRKTAGRRAGSPVGADRAPRGLTSCGRAGAGLRRAAGSKERGWSGEASQARPGLSRARAGRSSCWRASARLKSESALTSAAGDAAVSALVGERAGAVLQDGGCWRGSRGARGAGHAGNEPRCSRILRIRGRRRQRERGWVGWGGIRTVTDTARSDGSRSEK
jgi:hypothetical protein